MTAGEAIKALRKQKGYTLEQLGEKCGVGKSTVRKWEEGLIKNMGRDKILLLSQALDVTPDYIICLDSDNIEPQLPKEVEELLSIYNTLNEEKQNQLLQYAKFLRLQ